MPKHTNPFYDEDTDWLIDTAKSPVKKALFAFGLTVMIVPCAITMWILEKFKP